MVTTAGSGRRLELPQPPYNSGRGIYDNLVSIDEPGLRERDRCVSTYPITETYKIIK